jgi:glycosyltransferase involved in cell wall biosynthesis
MNILVVSQTPPWPEVTGARIRLANMLRGLQRLGEIDLFVLADPDQSVLETQSPDPRIRTQIVDGPASNLSLSRRLRWMLRGRLPLPFTGRDYGAARSQFAAWARPRYDLIWLSRAGSYLALRHLIQGPVIVDLDDLEDQKIAARLSVRATNSGADTGGPASAVRQWASAIQAAKNARLWRRLQEEITAAVDVVVVCSEADRRRLDAANVSVIPNGYTRQERPVGRADVGDPPTIAFPGFFRYPPNQDGAHYLVRSIAPLMRTRIPDIQIRIVGSPGPAVLRLHRPPNVVVTGFVPEIESELARADIIAVPIRFGGGTRIKILEAFAHRIPVVSTTAGAEGIEATPGRHLLIGDEPEAFAGACVRLLTDPALRRALVDAAHRFFLERYRWDDIHPRIASLAANTAARHAQPVHA